jgi:uncharacterized protein (TIGR04255 family)
MSRTIMAKPRRLANAPITEALIDVQVAARGGFTFADLKSAMADMDFGYYVKSPIIEKTLAFQWAPDVLPPQTRAESTEVGLRLHSQDERYVAQCRLTGFTMSRLTPYETWESLLQETARIWNVYRERTRPVRLTRVATRYINNLRLPLASGESYQDYITKLVDVPNEAPQFVEAFFQRFQLVDPTNSARVVLTLALEGVPPDGPAPVILDVDAFCPADLEPNDQELWVILERLRDLKNRSFFGTLTERALRLYA